MTWSADRRACLHGQALDWIQQQTFDGTQPITREALRQDFSLEGGRFPLVDAGRGIRNPAGWDAALTITTATSRSGRGRLYAYDEGRWLCAELLGQ